MAKYPCSDPLARGCKNETSKKGGRCRTCAGLLRRGKTKPPGKWDLVPAKPAAPPARAPGAAEAPTPREAATIDVPPAPGLGLQDRVGMIVGASIGGPPMDVHVQVRPKRLTVDVDLDAREEVV